MSRLPYQRPGRSRPKFKRTFLFLQGPASPFFSELASALAAHGHSSHRINLCIGDRLFWRRPGFHNYRGKPADWPRFIDDYMGRHGVTDLILLGEQREYHRHAIVAAKARGVQAVATDLGYLRPDWIAFERDGMNGASRFPRDVETVREVARRASPPDLARLFNDSFWTMAFREMIYDLSNWFLWFLYPHYVPCFTTPAPLIYLGNGRRLLAAPGEKSKADRLVANLIENKKNYFFFPLQLQEDFQIRAYSDFPQMESAIEKVINSFASHTDSEVQLLVKVHPLDCGVKNWRRFVDQYSTTAGVSERVHYLDGGDLDAVAQGARGTVTINSTAGLQALRVNCPVIALGKALYNLPGLTFQGSLDQFWSNPQPPDPAFLNDFITAITSTLMIRGVYHRRAGLQAAVSEAAYRLHHNLVNQVLNPRIQQPHVKNGQGSR